MKRLSILLLYTIPFLGFKMVDPAEGLGELKNLVGHTWHLQMEATMGGGDTKRMITYTEGAMENVINFKTTELSAKTGEYESFSEGSIVYNKYTEDIHFSETYYMGDIYIGYIYLADADGFTFAYNNHTDRTDHFFPSEMIFTKQDDGSYEVKTQIPSGDESLTIAKGTLTMVE